MNASNAKELKKTILRLIEVRDLLAEKHVWLTSVLTVEIANLIELKYKLYEETAAEVPWQDTGPWLRKPKPHV